MIALGALVALWSGMCICDVAIQRVKVFEHLTAVRTRYTISGLAVDRLLVKPECGRRLKFLLASLHVAPVPFPFPRVVDLMLPQR